MVASISCHNLNSFRRIRILDATHQVSRQSVIIFWISFFRL